MNKTLGLNSVQRLLFGFWEFSIYFFCVHKLDDSCLSIWQNSIRTLKTNSHFLRIVDNIFGLIQKACLKTCAVDIGSKSLAKFHYEQRRSNSDQRPGKLIQDIMKTIVLDKQVDIFVLISANALWTRKFQFWALRKISLQV